MPTIHPRPKLVYLRDDGDGGLDLVITTAGGETFVQPLKPTDAARWQAQLAEWTGQKLKALETRT